VNMSLTVVEIMTMIRMETGVELMRAHALAFRRSPLATKVQAGTTANLNLVLVAFAQTHGSTMVRSSLVHVVILMATLEEIGASLLKALAHMQEPLQVQTGIIVALQAPG
jgi:hypothetical protein